MPIFLILLILCVNLLLHFCDSILTSLLFSLQCDGLVTSSQIIAWRNNYSQFIHTIVKMLEKHSLVTRLGNFCTYYRQHRSQCRSHPGVRRPKFLRNVIQRSRWVWPHSAPWCRVSIHPDISTLNVFLLPIHVGARPTTHLRTRYLYTTQRHTEISSSNS